MIKIVEVWGADFDKLANELVNVDRIVLDFLNEVRYTINSDGFNNVFKYNIPVTILTPYLRELPSLLNQNQHAEIIHWETYWFNRTYKAWGYHQHSNDLKNLQMFNPRNGELLTYFKYPYITLNNIAKKHRSLVMDLLAKHNLIDKGAIAWRDILRVCDDIRHTFPPDVTDSVYMNYQYKYWKPKRMILDQNINDRFLQETLPVEFNQSFMQLVTESDELVPFFSEKTATPVLLNKPFLIAGAVGNHTMLKNRGFLLYDELFDYSFDNESDIELRYEGLIENVKRISSMSVNDMQNMHTRLFDKLVYNKQHAINLINTVPKEIISLFDAIKQENTDQQYGSLNILL